MSNSWIAKVEVDLEVVRQQGAVEEQLPLREKGATALLPEHMETRAHLPQERMVKTLKPLQIRDLVSTRLAPSSHEAPPLLYPPNVHLLLRLHQRMSLIFRHSRHRRMRTALTSKLN